MCSTCDMVDLCGVCGRDFFLRQNLCLSKQLVSFIDFPFTAVLAVTEIEIV